MLKKTQTNALAKFTASNNIDFSVIKWLILFKINCLAPRNTDSCSICTLKRMAIAKANREKALIFRKELATTCLHHRSSYFLFCYYFISCIFCFLPTKFCFILAIDYLFTRI